MNEKFQDDRLAKKVLSMQKLKSLIDESGGRPRHVATSFTRHAFSILFYHCLPGVLFERMLQAIHGSLKRLEVEDIGEPDFILTQSWGTVKTCGGCKHYRFIIIIERFK